MHLKILTPNNFAILNIKMQIIQVISFHFKTYVTFQTKKKHNVNIANLTLIAFLHYSSSEQPLLFQLFVEQINQINQILAHLAHQKSNTEKYF